MTTNRDEQQTCGLLFYRIDSKLLVLPLAVGIMTLMLGRILVHSSPQDQPRAQQSIPQPFVAESPKQLTSPAPEESEVPKVGAADVTPVAFEELDATNAEAATKAIDKDEVSEPTAEELDKQFHEQVIGVWEDDFQGKRTLTVRKDGTATMVVELTGVKAKFFAPKLTFEMTWKIEDGVMKKVSTGGKPKTKVNIVLRTVGRKVDEPIVKLTEDELVLLDKDGETKYEWKRVRDDKDKAAADSDSLDSDKAVEKNPADN